MWFPVLFSAVFSGTVQKRDAKKMEIVYTCFVCVTFDKIRF